VSSHLVKYYTMSCEKLQEQIKWQIGDLDPNLLEHTLTFAEWENLSKECQSLPSSNRATVLRAFASRGSSVEKLTKLDLELHQKAIDQATSYLQRSH